MNKTVNITEINITPVKPRDGLLGFCSFVINENFYFGGVAIFARMDGGLRLVYPKKNGVDCMHPIKKNIGDQITEAISKKFNTFLNLTEKHYDYNRTN